MLRNGWATYQKKEKGRRLKEQSINGTNDEEIMTEIIKSLLQTKNKVTSDKGLCWTKRLEVQRVQKALSEVIKDTTEYKEVDAL